MTPSPSLELAQPIAELCHALQQRDFKTAVTLATHCAVNALARAQCLELRNALFEQRKWLNTYPLLLLRWAQAEKKLNAAPETIEKLLWRILKWQPEHPDALKALGTLKAEQQHFEQAMVLFRRLTQLTPTDWEIWHAGSRALRALQKPAEALTWLQEGLRHAPSDVHADFHAALALLCVAQNDPPAAQQAVEMALAQAPQHPEALHAQALLLQQQGQLEAAHRCAQKALETAPDYPPLRFLLAQLDLTLGRWATGFAGYESRWAGAETAQHLPTIGRPQWRGHALYPGSRIAVLSESAVSYQLQFARFIPLLLQRAARVDWCVPAELFNLLANNFTDSRLTLHRHPSTLPRHLIDVECPLLSLPLALGITLDNLPAPEAYLYPPPPESAVFAARLSGIGALKVGLAWHDDTATDPLTAQQIPLHALAQLDVPGVLFVNVQKPLAAESVIPPLSTWADWMPECDDFNTLAALISGLDLVICVDGSIAHLAGALGKPVWLLNPINGRWHWLHEHKNSPWYPSMRVLTQTQNHDWTPLLQGIKTALQHIVAS